ncbi:sugar phosphate isomerase/epimerase family protein [Plastorhodobacter daqingensis]|uniref:Sugar phosphate isomerase/epimerase family protein n=1 Tax=Plastorhodobacter daqingensis TaxID=1387281 RepID=A0ABW2UMJ4_9RHOB
MPDLPLLGAAMTVADLESLQDFCVPGALDQDWAPIAERARALLAGYQGRLGIHGPFWGLHIASADAEIRKVVARRMMQGLEVCDYLGATQMVIHSPYITWDYHNLDNFAGRVAYQNVIEHSHQTLEAVVKRAEEVGVTLVIENIMDKDPDIRATLAESFASSSVALSVDTGHAHYAFGSTGAPPVDYFVRRAGAALQHIHLQDADGYADRHWSIGEGTISWHAVFRALAELDSNPRLILELRDKDGILPSVAWLEARGLAC